MWYNGCANKLLEHQSTVNENMPLRMLLYIARLYEKLINSKNIYWKARIPLFTPQFVVFYNGDENGRTVRKWKS